MRSSCLKKDDLHWSVIAVMALATLTFWPRSRLTTIVSHTSACMMNFLSSGTCLTLAPDGGFAPPIVRVQSSESSL